MSATVQHFSGILLSILLSGLHHSYEQCFIIYLHSTPSLDAAALYRSSQMIDVAHLPQGFVRGCPRSGWSTAVAPGQPTAARETEDTAPVQRASPSPQAKTIRLVSLWILEPVRNETRGTDITTSPTQIMHHIWWRGVGETLQKRCNCVKSMMHSCLQGLTAVDHIAFKLCKFFVTVDFSSPWTLKRHIASIFIDFHKWINMAVSWFKGLRWHWTMNDKLVLYSQAVGNQQ